MSDIIRVLIVDDDHILRAALATFVHANPSVQVVASIGDGDIAADDVVAEVQDLDPDVILLGLFLSEQDCIPVIGQILSRHPEFCVLILTNDVQSSFVSRTLAAGILGVIPSHAETDDLFTAICRVSDGERYVHPSLSLAPAQERRMRSPASLSEREHEVLRLMAQGLSNRAIADELHVSPRTIGNHVGSILAKLRLDNRTQAVIYAFKLGLVSVSLCLSALQLLTIMIS